MTDDTLYSDDLLPLDGGIINLNPPEEQVADENLERAMVKSAGPMIDEVVSWFDTQIQALDSIKGLDLESSVDVRAQIIGREIAVTLLTSSRERLVSLRDAHIAP